MAGIRFSSRPSSTSTATPPPAIAPPAGATSDSPPRAAPCRANVSSCARVPCTPAPLHPREAIRTGAAIDARFLSRWSAIADVTTAVAARWDRKWRQCRRTIGTLLVMLFVLRLVAGSRRQGDQTALAELRDQCRALDIVLLRSALLPHCPQIHQTYGSPELSNRRARFCRENTFGPSSRERGPLATWTTAGLRPGAGKMPALPGCSSAGPRCRPRSPWRAGRRPHQRAPSSMPCAGAVSSLCRRVALIPREKPERLAAGARRQPRL